VGPLNDTSEPNNFKYPELCVAGNWTEVYGKPAAWGWSDVNCLTKLPGLCRQQSERRERGPAARTAAACSAVDGTLEQAGYVIDLQAIALLQCLGPRAST
jgi:hypothetical protein